jgi:hypothetical protein
VFFYYLTVKLPCISIYYKIITKEMQIFFYETSNKLLFLIFYVRMSGGEKNRRFLGMKKTQGVVLEATMIFTVLFCSFLLFSVKVSAADSEKVNIISTQPQVGEPLEVQVDSESTDVTYQWFVGGNFIGGG